MKRFVAGLILLAVVRGILYQLVVPPWQAPDVAGHFEFVALIAELKHIPTSQDNSPELTREIIDSAREHRFEIWHNVDLDYLLTTSPLSFLGPREVGYQRPLYYLLLAPIYSFLYGQPVLVRYYGVTLTSALLAAGTVFLSARTAQTLFPANASLQLAIPVVTLFWPMQSYLAGVLNNDNLSSFAGAWVFWSLTRLFRRGWGWSSAAALSGGFLLAQYTKRSTLYLTYLLILAVVLYAGMAWLSGRSDGMKRRVRLGLIVTAAALFSAGLVILAVPSWTLSAAYLVGSVPLESLGPVANLLQRVGSGAFPAGVPQAIASYLPELLRSLWARFGWSPIGMPEAAYQAAGLTMVISLLGLITLAWRQPAWLHHSQKAVLLLFAVAVLAGIAMNTVITMLNIYFWGFPPAPGRYLVSLLIPVSTLMALGWHQLFPRALRVTMGHVLMAQMLLFDSISLAWTLIPHFYK